MVLIVTPSKAQKKLAESLRSKRLNMDLTQKGLSDRSNVALPTLRKFEQKGVISLESFLKLLMVLGGIEDLIKALKPTATEFASIKEVLKTDQQTTRKRGRRQ